MNKRPQAGSDRQLFHMRGASILKTLLLVPVALVLVIALAFAFFEGRKAYWDYRVREMCEKDGGVTVYEQVVLTRDEYKRLGGQNGGLTVPSKDDAQKKGYPYFDQSTSTMIRESSPTVVRGERVVKLRSDGKILGRAVQYWRRGGDFPTGLSHDSSFICPQHTLLSQQIFKVEGRHDD